MTPTLKGRVQTRLLLIGAIGVPITIPFALLAFPFVPLPFLMLVIVLFVGLALDPVYHLIQQRRWDHDWPVWWQIVAGFVEFMFALPLLIGCGSLWPQTICLVPLHYGLVWLAMFAMIQGPIRVLVPGWRFRGGEIGARGGRR